MALLDEPFQKLLAAWEHYNVTQAIESGQYAGPYYRGGGTDPMTANRELATPSPGFFRSVFGPENASYYTDQGTRGQPAPIPWSILIAVGGVVGLVTYLVAS